MSRLIKRISLYLLLLLSLLACGCIFANGRQEEKLQPSQGYTVVDAVGRQLTLPKKPTRIVSLNYGSDEILTELVDYKKIVAYSRWAGDDGITFITKAEARRVGCRVGENVEKVLSLRPDIVFVTEASDRNFVENLEAVGLKVYQAKNPQNYEEMREKVLGIAEAVGEVERGRELVRKMDTRLAKLDKKLAALPDKKRKVAVAFGFESAIGRRGGLLDYIMGRARVINGVGRLESRLNIDHVSKEQVVKINPDVFLLPTWNVDNKHDLNGYYKSILYDEAYSNVKAIKNNQLKFVSDKYRYVSSHHIVDAIENMAQAVYPELFRGE